MKVDNVFRTRSFNVKNYLLTENIQVQTRMLKFDKKKTCSDFAELQKN